jgi:hypothetical protein
VTFQYITSVGFNSKNDRAILTVLKFIGFVDNSGVPTEVWRAYRNKSQSKRVLAATLVKSYGTLFDTYPDANRKDNEALRNFFSGHTSVAENTVTLMVRTFKTLAEMGDFESPAELPDVDINSDEEPERDDVGQTVINRKLRTAGMTMNINIELQIPATDNAEIYESFFAAMKKHLLS